MIERFNNTIDYIIISSLLAFIVGLIMVIFPQLSIQTTGIIVASYIIVLGIYFIVLGIKYSKYYIPFDGLVTGIISVLLGIFLLCRPSLLSIAFTIVIGIWMIISSINYIKIAMKLSKTRLPWISILVLGILDLIAGFIVLVNPFAATISITLFIGIMLMIHSIITIVDIILIKKDIRNINKVLGEEIKALSK